MEKTKSSAKASPLALDGRRLRALLQIALKNLRVAIRDKGEGGELLFVLLCLLCSLFLLLPLDFEYHIIVGMTKLFPPLLWSAYLAVCAAGIFAGVASAQPNVRRIFCFLTGLVWSLVALTAIWYEWQSLTTVILPLVAVFALWLALRWQL